MVAILREGPPSRTPSEPRLGLGSSVRESCHRRASVTSFPSRSSIFRLSSNPDSGREGVDFRVDLVPTLVRGGLGRANWDCWSFGPVGSGSGETLTKRSSSPGLVSVVRGLAYCSGGGEESPEGVGEVSSLKSLAPGRGDTATVGSSFLGTLDIVAGVWTLSGGFELPIESPSATKSDFLNSELSDVDERLEDEETEVDADDCRRRSRAAVMTIGAETLFLLVGFIPLDRCYVLFSRWAGEVVS